MTCPVCDGPATVELFGTHPRANCARCGRFLLQDRVAEKLTRNPEQKEKVRCLLAERRLKGLHEARLIMGASEEFPEASAINLEEFISGFPSSPAQYFDRALLNLARLVHHPSDTVPIIKDTGPLFCRAEQLAQMMAQLEGLGLVSARSPLQDVSITPAGWERIEKLKRPGLESKQAFTAMWFSPERDAWYTEGIRPAIESDGLTKSVRIDRKEHNGKIDDEIIAEIRRSRYVVADFTGQRGGVYYEAGFAMGLGIPVIWCVDEREVNALHFDTRQYNHIAYKTPEDLRTRLTNRIRALAL